ncbi:hypothetical protein BGZ63DRAFT_465659 [Mariannaea sp. PMI_226]|nr:hypothetical protein BGZ63DRAFT_465659 [Mariannaea sp. PMI_226]
MSNPSGIQVSYECITAVHQLHGKRTANTPRFVICKISDDESSVVVDETSTENDYEVFLEKLAAAVDANGKPAPRYAVYQIEIDLGESGTRIKNVFISWVPYATTVKARTLYASTREHLNRALNIGASIHADDLDDLDWDAVVKAATRGRIY